MIESLFVKSNSFLVFPIKVVYQFIDDPQDSPVKMGVSVSSKKFKNATDRNRIKRLLREVYRTNKQPLHEKLVIESKQIAVFLMYIDKELPPISLIKKKMPIVIEKLIKAIHEKSSAIN